MNRVQETSLAAFADAIPKLGARQKAVVEALREHGPHTNLELSYILHWPINVTTPRVRELVLMGVVREKEKRPCHHSGRRSIAWEVIEQRAQQTALFI